LSYPSDTQTNKLRQKHYLLRGGNNINTGAVYVYRLDTKLTDRV